MTKLSPAELSYLRDSLASHPPIRPDARSPTQYLPLEASVGFLPAANGSARVRASDGGECIVGVKTTVVRPSEVDDLISIGIDIEGARDDDAIVLSLTSIVTELLGSSVVPQLRKRLRLTTRFAYKLHIDATVLAHNGNPLSIVTLAVYLALKTTKLPLLLSSTDDAKAEEVPVFHDDWDQAVALCEGFNPPIALLMAVVGDTVLLDPSKDEAVVADMGIYTGYANGAVTGPIRTIDLGSLANLSTREPGIRPSALTTVYKVAAEAGDEVIQSLDAIAAAEEDQDENMVKMF
uniref:Ribosomal RNA-processing protein 42 n=1 Tax=Blastobotrys adeninivorans TaxID=409370 RepID=A0A060T7X1_BLAAD